MTFPEQATAAANIRRAYLVRRVRYAILKAECQAGKFGAYQELIRLMLLHGDVQHAYILCGSSELSLYEQVLRDTLAEHGDAFRSGQIKVLFRQHFKNAVLDVTNALIVVDESHLDQTQGQELGKFLARYGLSLDGNPAPLQAQNTYMLSVDATPYAELAAMTHKETPHEKHVETLQPGPGYYGLTNYKYDRKLLPTFSIASEPARFERLLFGMEQKYVLMRLRTVKNAREPHEETVKAICRRNGFNCLYYTAERTEINILHDASSPLPSLENAPAVTTVVIVKGRLYAGQVVPKEHIGLVWEGAKNSKTDSLVQGLPGRMCGYRFGAAKPLIFVPESALKEHPTKVIKASEMGRAVMDYPLAIPTKGTNLGTSRNPVRPTNGKTQCPPFRFNLPNADEDEWTPHTEGWSDMTDRQKGTYCLGIFQQEHNLAQLREAPFLTAEQKQEILGFLGSANPDTHVRNLTGTSQLAYFKDLLQAHETHTTPAEHISDCPSMTFVIPHRGYRGIGSNPNHVYVLFYTYASSGARQIVTAPLLSRIPKTNGKSIFSQHELATQTTVVAGGGLTFDEASIASPARFEAALREYLRLYTTQQVLGVSPFLVSNNDRFKFLKETFYYTSPRQNAVKDILRRVGPEFGLSLKIHYARSADTYFNVKKITW